MHMHAYIQERELEREHISLFSLFLLYIFIFYCFLFYLLIYLFSLYKKLFLMIFFSKNSQRILKNKKSIKFFIEINVFNKIHEKNVFINIFVSIKVFYFRNNRNFIL